MIFRFWLRGMGLVSGAVTVAVLVCLLLGGLIPADVLAYQSVGTFRSDIMVIDITRRLSINLTRNPHDTDKNPAWSPDGQHIAFESFGERHDGVYVMDYAGRDVRLISVHPGAGAPTWSPDGRSIAYTVLTSGTSRIVVMDMVTGQTQPFTAGQTFNYHPVWSPDGTRLAFQGGNYDDYYVYVATLDSDRAQRLVIADPAWEVQADPAWSPDGRFIAFGMRQNIYIVPVEGNAAAMQQLTTTPYLSSNPAWSPNGTRLAYDEERHIVGSRTLQQTIRVIDVAGTHDPFVVAGLRPAWRP